jgi:hypothetical protein
MSGFLTISLKALKGEYNVLNTEVTGKRVAFLLLLHSGIWI